MSQCFPTRPPINPLSIGAPGVCQPPVPTLTIRFGGMKVYAQ
jgi:hypothetical protein